MDKTVEVVPPNHKSACENPEVVAKKIKKKIQNGRVIGLLDKPPFQDFICSPLGLVPKKEAGSFHLIHDLSFPEGDCKFFYSTGIFKFLIKTLKQ